MPSPCRASTERRATSIAPTALTSADQSRSISGVYSTFKGIENNTYDFYYLYFDEREPSPTLMDGSRHTIGSRIAGKQPVKDGKTLVGTWNWDAEGAFQFGEDNFGSPANRDVQAGMVGALGGYTFEDVTWKPSIGGIFYWGSGDNDPTTGTINTFNMLYPLGHAYWGQIDNLAGQNLLDYGVQAGLKPHEKFTLVSQWHYFEQAQASNVLLQRRRNRIAGQRKPELWGMNWTLSAHGPTARHSICRRDTSGSFTAMPSPRGRWLDPMQNNFICRRRTASEVE